MVWLFCESENEDRLRMKNHIVYLQFFTAEIEISKYHVVTACVAFCHFCYARNFLQTLLLAVLQYSCYTTAFSYDFLQVRYHINL